MFQGVMNLSHGGGGLLYSSNENRLGFSDSDGFQNPQFASVNVNQDGFEADKKRIKLMGSSNQHQVGRQIDLFGDSEPLGLSLKKTPSFLNLIEAKLSQGTKEKTTTNTTTSNETNQISKRSRSRATDMDSQTMSEKLKASNFTQGTKEKTTTNTTTSNETNQISKRSRSRATDMDSQTMSEKLKASNFTATLLRIGTWERVARNEGDLVAKCYYAKRKLVWEVLENGLKSKIEILWSDISAIRASFPEQQPGTLELELKHEPKFYREHNPQPRKHTLWHEATDFTGGQAKIYRRHYLQFPEGTPEKHFEKLLQYDKELLKLSQRKFPVSNSPFFQSDPYESHQDFYLDFKGGNHHQQFPSMLQFSHLAIQSLPPYPASKFNQTNGPPFVTPNDSASPMSVMDMSFFDESIGYPGIQQRSPFMETPMVNDNLHMAGGNQAPELLIIPHNQIGEFIPRFGESNENLVGRFGSIENLFGGRFEESNGNVLGRGSLYSNNSVYDHLLNETQRQHINEERLLAKVNSMACLLEAATNEHNPVTQNTCISHDEEYYKDNNTNTNNSMESSSTDQSSYGNGEWSNSYQDSISWIQPQGNGDPFPRTPSFPCLLFDTPVEDFSNVNHQPWR